MKLDLTQTEVLLLKTMITDRMQQKFEKARIAADNMDNKVLRACAEEIDRMETLGKKLEGKEEKGE